MENEKNYLSFLNELKKEIAESRIKVAFTVNEQLLQLYWKIGNRIF